MSIADVNIRTLRHLRGAMTPPENAKGAVELQVLRALVTDDYVTVRRLGESIDLPLNQLYSTVSQLYRKKHVEREGECGAFRYRASRTGRAFIEGKI